MIKIPHFTTAYFPVDLEAKLNSRIFALFESHGWKQGTCKSCRAMYFYKGSSKETCMSPKCAEYSFFRKNGKNIDIISIYKKILKYFSEMNYHIVLGNNILNTQGDTIFKVAAIHYIQDSIFDRGAYERKRGKRFLVVQPSIRLNHTGREMLKIGFSSSFVNISTLIVEPAVDDYIAAVRDWIEALSRARIYVPNLTVKRLPSDFFMRNRRGLWQYFRSYSLGFYYLGLPLGDINFIAVPTSWGKRIFLMDGGFGLEHIAWAREGIREYFKVEFPRDVYVYPALYYPLDCLKTLVLAIMGKANLKAHREARKKLKKLLSPVVEFLAMLDTETYISRIYAYWKNFLSSMLSEDDVIHETREFLYYFMNLKFARYLGLKKLDNALYRSFPEYAAHVQERYHVSAERIDAYVSGILKRANEELRLQSFRE